MATFYAYVHARPNTVDAAGIFYAGKGKNKRASEIIRRNPYHANVVKKYGAENILVGKMDCSSEAIAFDLERGLIKCLRRMNVKLTNQTDGGEGAAGYKPTPEEIERNRNKSPEELVAISTRMKQNNPMKRPEVVGKVSKSLTGLKQSEETKKKRANSNRGKKRSAETRLKFSKAQKGVPKPSLRGENNSMKRPEVRLKASLAQKGKRLSEEHTKNLQGSHVGNKWVVNVYDGSTLMRCKSEIDALLSSGNYRLGRKL